MAATKRKTASPPAKEPTRVYTFNLSERLVAEIDAIALEEKRSRSRQVEFALAGFVRQYHSRKAAA
jgi:hypothetical protein